MDYVTVPPLDNTQTILEEDPFANPQTSTSNPTSSQNLPQILTADEVAAHFRVSKTTIANWRKSGRLVPTISIPGGQQYYMRAQIDKEPILHPDEHPQPATADPALTLKKRDEKEAQIDEDPLDEYSDENPYRQFIDKYQIMPSPAEEGWKLGAPYRRVITSQDYTQRLFRLVEKELDFAMHKETLPITESLTEEGYMERYVRLTQSNRPNAAYRAKYGNHPSASSPGAIRRLEQITALPSMVVTEPVFHGGVYIGSRVGMVVAAMPVLHYIRRAPWWTFKVLASDWYAKALQTAALRMKNPRNESEQGNQPILFWTVRTAQVATFSAVNLHYQESGIGPASLIRASEPIGAKYGLKIGSERTTDDLAAFLQDQARPDPANTFRLSGREALARFLYLPRTVPIPDYEPSITQNPMVSIRMIQAYHLDWAVLNGEISPIHARRVWPEMSVPARLDKCPIQTMITIKEKLG